MAGREQILRSRYGVVENIGTCQALKPFLALVFYLIDELKRFIDTVLALAQSTATLTFDFLAYIGSGVQNKMTPIQIP